jgi:nucleotide-binding universal stress UspA family protein
MSKILCATRGGEASYRSQDAAIALAKTRGAELVFLFVVDIGFLDKTERAVRPDVVAEEMTHLGEFLLSMAQERAKAEGVTAQRLIYRGRVRQELTEAAKREGADTLILGKPVDEGSAFSLAALERLAHDIEQETGVRVQVC